MQPTTGLVIIYFFLGVPILYIDSRLREAYLNYSLFYSNLLSIPDFNETRFNRFDHKLFYLLTSIHTYT